MTQQDYLGWQILLWQDAGGGWRFLADNPGAPEGGLQRIDPHDSFGTQDEALAVARGIIDERAGAG